MAIFHCKVQIIKRSSGRGIIAAAAYRSGERILEEKTQNYYDFHKRTGILHAEIMAPLCVPEWVYDRHVLWNKVDAVEKRKDAQLAREVMVALPKELSANCYIELVRCFVVKNFVKEGMIADFAIHAPSNQKGGQNYHAHILLTQRSINTEGFGLKVRQWNQASYLYHWREAWANETNQILEREGFECRIDHRSRATKELEQEPLNLLAHQEIYPDHLSELQQGDESTEVLDHKETFSQLRSKRVDFDDMDQLPTELRAQEVEYAEILKPDLNLDRILKNQAGLKFLLSLKNNPFMSLEERKAEFDNFAGKFNSRLSRINTVIRALPNGEAKDRFLLQVNLENSYFNAYSNKILATLLEEKDTENASEEIRALFRQSQTDEHNYKKYSNEWHSRAVRNRRYFVFDSKASDKIERIIAVENAKWSELLRKSMVLRWTPEELEKETQRLQEQLDKTLALSFELKKDLEHDRHRDR